jgi:hypothetical protein
MLEQISGTSSPQQNMEKSSNNTYLQIVLDVQPNNVWTSMLCNFICGGHLNLLVYSAPIEN